MIGKFMAWLGALTLVGTVVSAQTILSENFDGVTAPSLPAGWVATAGPGGAGSAADWVTRSSGPASSPNSVFANNAATASDHVLVTPTLAIGTGTHTLTFNLKWDTEDGFDGCVLEIDIGVTGTFTDILTAGGNFNANGYNGVISSGASSAIAGRLAWTNVSPGGTYAAVDMSLPASAASSNIKLRWRMASDNSLGDVGVDLDDVLLLGPAGAQTPPNITTSAPTSVIVGNLYSYTVAATGTPAPTFSIAPDPATLGSGWLTWSGGNTLSGTPAAGDVGTYGPFTITATNGVNPNDTEVFSINVVAANPEIEVRDPNNMILANNSTLTVYAGVMTTASTGTFTINNLGNVSLNISAFVASNLVNCTDSSTAPGATIAAAGNDTFNFSFTPTAPGAFSGTLTITNNDADEGSFVINFTGEAKAAAANEIALLNPTGGNFANGGTFSQTNTGTMMFNHAFTIRNEGGATLTLSGGPVAISNLVNCTVTPNQPASSSLGAAAAFLPTDEGFNLDITPTAAGAFSFTVTIGNDDTDENPFTFIYSGHTAVPTGGGGGGGDDGGCSTGGNAPYSWMLLLGLLSLGAVAIRMRKA